MTVPQTAATGGEHAHRLNGTGTSNSAKSDPSHNGIDESTQTNGFADPHAGELNKKDIQGPQWTVRSALHEFNLRYAEATTSPIPFFHLLERLKTTKRAGWRRFGLEHAESIADHMYRMSILTMMAPEAVTSKIDFIRCCRMALIHDMAEALVGDITPVDDVSKEEKSRRESDTMDYICNNLLGRYNGGLNGQQLRELWQEYEDSKTLDSQFVHDIDKVELILQMVEYERSQWGETDLGEFTWVSHRIQFEVVRGWADKLLRERLVMWREIGKEPNWADGTKPEL